MLQAMKLEEVEYQMGHLYSKDIVAGYFSHKPHKEKKSYSSTATTRLSAEGNDTGLVCLFFLSWSLFSVCSFGVLHTHPLSYF